MPVLSRDVQALLRSAGDEMFLPRNMPPKQNEEEQGQELARLRSAMAKGGVLGISPSVPWPQMSGYFEMPADPAAQVSSNIKVFSGNYMNMLAGTVLITTMLRRPKRALLGLALNGAVFASESSYRAAAAQLRNMRVTPTWLRYATALSGQGFIVLLAVLSRKGRLGLLLGNLLVLAHAVFRRANQSRPQLVGVAACQPCVEENMPPIKLFTCPHCGTRIEEKDKDKHTCAQTNADSDAAVAAGAKTGTFAVRLSWANDATHTNDLDLWVTTPDGEKIYFDHTTSKCGGKLDTDEQQSAGIRTENITWDGNPPNGRYKVEVQNYSQAKAAEVPFRVYVTHAGSTQEIHKTMRPNPNEGAKQVVVIGTYEVNN